MNASPPPAQKRPSALVGGLIPPSASKTSATAEGGSKKSHYRPLPKEFRHDGFTYRQLARERGSAIYEQTWRGRSEPSLCYEVIRIRRRDGFQIGEKFIEPYEVYPNSAAWGSDGFTFTDRDNALPSFLNFVWKNRQKEEGR